MYLRAFRARAAAGRAPHAGALGEAPGLARRDGGERAAAAPRGRGLHGDPRPREAQALPHGPPAPRARELQ